MPFGTKIRFEPRTPVEAALVAEFEYAAARINRLRRAQEDALERLMAQGLDETGALGHRCLSKGYQAARRDEMMYLQMWLRLSRRLEKVPVEAAPGDAGHAAASDEAPPPAAASSVSRDAAPRNARCPCGSGLKYKRCCLGKPLPRAA